MKKLDYSGIKLNIENQRYTLNTTELEWNSLSTRIPISITCPNGHTNMQKYNDFQQGKRCRICANNVNYDYSYIKKRIDIDGYVLLTTNNEYNDGMNVKSALKIECPNKHIMKTSYDNFVNKKKRCQRCYFDRNKGENHSRWNVYKSLNLSLRKSFSRCNIYKQFNTDKYYNNWINNPKDYVVDHIFPVKAFADYLIENNLTENKKLIFYLRENIINNPYNLQLLHKTVNRKKHYKYNKKQFYKFLKEKGVIKNEI